MPTSTLHKKNFNYIDKGEGFPIIFLHSYMCDSQMWMPQINYFKNQYRCIAPDLWSHGKSCPLPQKNYTLEDLVEDVEHFIKKLGLEEYAIVGLSVGGMIAAHLATSAEKKPSAIVLMDTFVGPEPIQAQAKYFSMLDMIEQSNSFPQAILDQLGPTLFSPHTLTHNQSVVDTFISQVSSCPPEQLPGMVALGRAIFSRKSILEKLHKITTPTLVIAGEDDQPRPPFESQLMAQHIPNAMLEIIPKAGHISNIEQPESVNTKIHSFLECIPDVALAFGTIEASLN